MFVRKLYYDNSSGAVLRNMAMEGDVLVTPLEDDLERLPQLSPYRDNPGNLGLFLWTEPDPEAEENMAKATKVWVDVSETPHVIMYDFTPLDSGTLTSDEVVGILNGEVE